MDESQIVKKNLVSLVSNLGDKGVSVSIDDVHFSLMNREEWIYIDGGLLDLGYTPGIQFGIYVDAEREKYYTDVSLLEPEQQKKAKVLIKLFMKAYSDIIDDIYEQIRIEG